MIRIESPHVLFLLLLVPLLVYAARILEDRLTGSFRFSNREIISKIKPSLRVKLRSALVYLRALSLAFVIVAASRPQHPIEESRVYVEGIDIALTVDCSGSMRAMDFEMSGKRFDRLSVVKAVVEKFIQERPDDRIGLVAFAGEAYTVCPLTLDHDWLEANLERVQIGMIEDGTAIGSAISASLNRLKDTEAADKIIILLTDGRNNAGKISPLSAAEAAKALDVRIYTIGAGTKGLAPYPMKDMFGDIVLQPVEIEIDDELLTEIADITGGKYFRATDTRSLNDIYDEIDRLEKTEIEEIGYNRYEELFWMFLLPGVLLLLAEIVLSNTVLRRIP